MVFVIVPNFFWCDSAGLSGHDYKLFKKM